MNEQELAAIEARANAATPGPWNWDVYQNDNFDGKNPLELWAPHALSMSATQDASISIGVTTQQEVDDADVEFIAHARQDVPALIAEVRRLRMEVAILSPPLKAEAPSGHVVIVCGGRGYTDVNHVYTELDAYHAANKITLLVEGGANGADSLAREWAKLRGVPLKTVPAQWGLHGRQAGAQRNAQMLQSKPVAVLAFPGGNGTLNMTQQAERKNVKVIRFQAVNHEVS